jgi:hypothetical protein
MFTYTRFFIRCIEYFTGAGYTDLGQKRIVKMAKLRRPRQVRYQAALPPDFMTINESYPLSAFLPNPFEKPVPVFLKSGTHEIRHRFRFSGAE